MAYLSTRTKWISITIAILLLLFFSASHPWNLFWGTVIGLSLFLVIVDVLLLSNNSLELDPFYSNYESRRDLDVKYD
ncbi:hypothetical protein BdWA1_002999 [Babesia duncani]|uniref:Uncharacterized protein n=1 Tax=Babesia duncani TaxID=323732 RepID=A0AAD9UMW2_9APIC|nr:hypothetical protein BdWA1_002999 [Babesia duncani]